MKDITLIDSDKPRNAKNWEKPGSYKTIFRVLSPVLDRGEMLEIEQFFSGYGEIENAKLMVYSSDDIFETKESKITHSLRPDEKGNINFGNAEDMFDQTGMHFDMSEGFKYHKWKDHNYFFDIGQSKAPQISTEYKIQNAPFTYKFLTKKNIKPGIYRLEFCFTYFNGEEWKNDSRTIEFTVRNFLEKHDILIGSFALVASIIAIIGIAVVPFVKWLLEVIK